MCPGIGSVNGQNLGDERPGPADVLNVRLDARHVAEAAKVVRRRHGVDQIARNHLGLDAAGYRRSAPVPTTVSVSSSDPPSSQHSPSR